MMIGKQDLPPPLRKYWDHKFSSGPCTGPDYRSFQSSYWRWLRKILKPAGYKLDTHGNHYEFSCVVTRKGEDGRPDRYVYISISDVRFFPREWAGQVMVRQMRHPTDWCGCMNHFVPMTKIKEEVDALMDKELERSI